MIPIGYNILYVGQTMDPCTVHAGPFSTLGDSACSFLFFCCYLRSFVQCCADLYSVVAVCCCSVQFFVQFCAAMYCVVQFVLQFVAVLCSVIFCLMVGKQWAAALHVSCLFSRLSSLFSLLNSSRGARGPLHLGSVARSSCLSDGP